MLERAVPKNRGAEFLDLIEDLANDTCIAGEPECPRCELRKICPYVLVRKNQDAADAAAARAAKPRPAKEKPAELAKAAPRVKAAEAAAPAPAKKAAPARSAKEPPPAPKASRGKHGTK